MFLSSLQQLCHSTPINRTQGPSLSTLSSTLAIFCALGSSQSNGCEGAISVLAEDPLLNSPHYRNWEAVGSPCKESAGKLEQHVKKGSGWWSERLNPTMGHEKDCTASYEWMRHQTLRTYTLLESQQGHPTSRPRGSQDSDFRNNWFRPHDPEWQLLERLCIPLFYCSNLLFFLKMLLKNSKEEDSRRHV